MNKKEFIESMVEKTGMSTPQAKIAFEAFISTMETALEQEKKVSFVGFGSFEVSKRAERVGVNPKTKEAITIAASNSVKFKAGKALKAIVNK